MSSLDAVGIISKNLKESAKFYMLLGMELKQVGGPDHLEATMPAGVRLMVDSEDLIKKLNPDWQRPTGSGIVLCFKQNSPADVDRKYEEIISSGFATIKEPWDAFWGQRYASVYDPDGNQVDIFANIEG